MPNDKLIALARAVKEEIEKRHARRGWTTGRKVWELRLLRMAKSALAELPKPATDDPNQLKLPL